MNNIKGRRASYANVRKKNKRQSREIQTWLSHMFFKELEPQNQRKVEMASKFLRPSTNVMELKPEKNQKSKDKNEIQL